MIKNKYVLQSLYTFLKVRNLLFEVMKSENLRVSLIKKNQEKAYLTETRPIRMVRIIVRASLLNIIRTQIAHNIKNSIQLERKA